MGKLDDERLVAQQNIERVAQVGRAAGDVAQLAGLRAFNWLFRPWSIVLIVALVAAGTWGIFAYQGSVEQSRAEQAIRDRAADNFARAVQYTDDQFDLNLTLLVVDIRNGRCTYEVTLVDCVYGRYRISGGKVLKQ